MISNAGIRAVVLALLTTMSIVLSAQSDEQWERISSLLSDSVELVIPAVDSLLNSSQDMDSTAVVKGIRYRGLANRTMGNYVQSIDDFTQVYEFAKMQRDSLLQAEAADQIGIMNTFMGNMSEGQTYLIEVAQLYEQVGTPADIAGANNGLAIFYNDIGRYDDAINLYDLTLEQYQAIADSLGMANVYGNLGLLYIDIKQYDKAAYNLRLQGHLDSLTGSEWGLGFHHDWTGLLFQEQGDLSAALREYEIALDIRRGLPSHYNLAETRAGLSSVYHAMGRYEESIDQAQEILKHKEDHQSLSQQMSAYSLLSRSFEKLADLDSALYYYKAYKEMSDSIYQRDMLGEIADKEALYQKAKQDKEIARLDGEQAVALAKIKHKNKVIGLAGFGILLVSFLLVLLYRLLQKVRRQKDLIAKALSEKDLLLREIHHRVKNNLQLVSGLLTLQSRSIDDHTVQQAIQEGKSRVRSMALIHQDLYNRDRLTHIGVKQYVKQLSRELFSTYTIDHSRVTLVTDVEDMELDVDTIIPLGLIINELISNALKYAFPEDRDGTLTVRMCEIEEKDQTILVLKVKDDGIGYDPREVREKSFGSTLIASLAEQLEGDLEVDTSVGTTVTLRISNYR